jgi:hypothetical protein
MFRPVIKYILRYITRCIFHQDESAIADILFQE